MRKLRTENGIVRMSESKAVCPNCNRAIPFEEIEEEYTKQSDSYFEMKLHCNHNVGITTDNKGDFIAVCLEKICNIQLN